MNLPIPRWLVRVWGSFVIWGNITLWWRVRRLDLLIVLFGILCAGYYGWLHGWQGALLGLAAYVMMVVVGLML